MGTNLGVPRGTTGASSKDISSEFEKMGTNDLFRQEGYDLMAAAFEVYNEKGHGFLESVLAPEHDAQLINYLKALQKRVGYLINFGHHPSLEWKRMVL